MIKPVSASGKPRKQHTSEFHQEALKLAERTGVGAAARELSLYESQRYAGAVNSNSRRPHQNGKANSPLKMSVSNASWLHGMRSWLFSKSRDILREAPEMKSVFIENHRAEFSIKAMCRVLRVARSGWYVCRLRRHQINTRHPSRLICDEAVRKAFTDAKQRYDAPCMRNELHAQGLLYNIKTIAASLRRQGLRTKASRRFSPASYRDHGLPVSDTC